MSKILEYDKWILESESEFELTREIADKISVNVPEVKLFKQNGILSSCDLFEKSISILVDCRSIQKIEWNMGRYNFEIFPNYFDLGYIDFTYVKSDKIDPGQFSVDMWFAKTGGKYRKKGWTGTKYEAELTREFIVEFNCINESQFYKIVDDSIRQIVKDEFCKIRLLITDKKLGPIKKSLSEGIIEGYKELVKNFFLKGGIPENGEYILVPIVAKTYEEGDEDVMELFNIVGEKFYNKIIEYSEKNLSPEFTSRLKKIARVKNILKMY